MPLSARAVPRRCSRPRVCNAPSVPDIPGPSITSWTDRLKKTVWDRTTGWVRRRFDEWVHRNLDQLLPEPGLLPLPPSIQSDVPHRHAYRPSIDTTQPLPTVERTPATYPHPVVDVPPWHSQTSGLEPHSFTTLPPTKRRRTRPPMSTGRGGQQLLPAGVGIVDSATPLPVGSGTAVDPGD